MRRISFLFLRPSQKSRVAETLAPERKERQWVLLLAPLLLLPAWACGGHLSSPPEKDASSKQDGNLEGDAGALDAALDAHYQDGGRLDASRDAGLPDAASPDSGPVDASPPLENRFGIGLTSPGNQTQWDLTANLVGQGGHIKLIFPGINLAMGAVPADWPNAVAECYARDLIPVIRMGPPWGDRNIRKEADDGAGGNFTNLAAKYRQVVEALPLREAWPLYVEVHNEPNLCYEWECAPGDTSDGWMDYHQTAAEYARFLRDVADAIHAIGDPRIHVLNGAMAPGGAASCECGGSGFTAGALGTDFMQAMADAVPDIWNHVDGLASHSYPATNIGYGFYRPYDQSMTGLLYFEQELAAVGRNLPVFITETGWPTDSDACDSGHCGSRDEIANWMVNAFQDPWLSNTSIQAVMPFLLQDGNWDQFAWVAVSGAHYPVYDAVQSLRCSLGLPPSCP